MIRTIDYHTAGEPFRIVVDGAPEIAGTTVAERRATAMTGPADRVRALLCNEPRGHADMYGAFLVPPDEPNEPGRNERIELNEPDAGDRPAAGGRRADLGVLFWHKDGFSTACGHGTIALGTYVVDAGLVAAPTDGEVDVLIDVPSGQVQARVRRIAGRTHSVTFRNVASYVWARQVPVPTPKGTLSVDLAYGGAFYACARAGDVGLSVAQANLGELVALGRCVRDGLNAAGAAVHPSDERLSGVYGTIWYDDLGPTPDGRHQRNCTVFADGEVDRSPCGSGTSARLALLHADALLPPGAVLRHDSVIGTTFLGRVVGEAVVAGRPAVLTEVSGSAYRTGEHMFVLDPDDPLGEGFQLR